MELRRHQNQNTENSQNLEDHLDAKKKKAWKTKAVISSQNGNSKYFGDFNQI